jgi:PIN domain
VTRKSGGRAQPPLRIVVLDRQALSLAVRGNRRMLAWLDLAAQGQAEVVTSPMTVIEAYDGRITGQRWDWLLSRLNIADIGKDDARQARRLLSEAKLHGHKYAIDAVLAVVARRQKGQVTILTSDVDDLERLVPDSIVVVKV